ncbi:MAG TPA: AzlC family ABC transporter permease [Dehalococcoidia bacterium]|nr:AzlC family ABC transporter permease [Dehalococcoidia bacterium]
MLPSRRTEFLAGVRAQLPLLLGVAPFGMAYGAYAVKAGLPSGLSQAMSAIVFAGASQFVGVRLIVRDVPAAVIVLTVLLVNLRHVLYSASLAPYVEHLDRRWRWLLAYLLTDEAYATAIVRYRGAAPSPYKHWFFLGTAITLWAAWQVSTGAGVFVGTAVPNSWSLDFALPLTFIALLVPMASERPALAAAAVAGLVAVVGFRWPYGIGLIVAAGAGMAAGIALDRALSPSAPAAADVEAGP